jgi:hypothetical protein
MPPVEPDRSSGSLAAGVGLAWLVMLVGEMLSFMTNSIGGFWLPPLAILVGGIVLLNRGKPRTGKGMLLGLLSIFAVLLLLFAACYGLIASHF